MSHELPPSTELPPGLPTGKDTPPKKHVAARHAALPSILNREVPSAIPEISGAQAQSPNLSIPKSADPLEGRLHTTGESESANAVRFDIIKVAPPWLISFFTHICFVLVLALIVVRPQLLEVGDIKLNYSEELGQSLDSSFDELVVNVGELGETDTVSQDLLAISDPLTAPLATGPTPELTGEGKGEAPGIRSLLSGRRAERRQGMIGKYGGDATTQEAVELALQWLANNQWSAGNWSLTGRYSGGVRGSRDSQYDYDNKESATAMALLAFQGAGYTHLEGKHARTVDKGWGYLLSRQQQDGSFFNPAADPSQRQYTNAQCTIALCEILAMSGDYERYREPAGKAVGFLVKSQAAEGGWRYEPGRDSDMSVTGWAAMALQSAKMAGLEVPDETLERLSEFLDSVERSKTENTIIYAYKPSSYSTPALTAEGALCRMYLGWPRDEERLTKAINYLNQNQIDLDNANVYHWYYATQVMHHYGGDHWLRWNSQMKATIPSSQVKKGKEEGSWEYKGDEWGRYGGRLYLTCLCTYMLEVYYRHLPLYDSIYSNEKQEVKSAASPLVEEKVADSVAPNPAPVPAAKR